MSKLFVLLCLLSLTACGGGGSTASSPANVTKLTVSGTASEGSLITGKTVKLKDATGKSATNTTTDTTTGTYSIDVTGLTAPYLVTVTGTNGTYVSLAQTVGTANINPITTTVVALAAGTSDVSSLFTSLTATQIANIKNNYTSKSALVSTSLQGVLPYGVNVGDYFTGTILAGKGMDAVFDTYRIAISPTAGITIKTNDATAATVLTIPTSTIAANTNQPLPNVMPVFTTNMISGKSFRVSSGVVIFNVNGTLSGSAANSSQTWIINSSGQLVIYNTGKGTATMTLVSGDATLGWTGTSTYSNGTSDSGTLVPETTVTQAFTSSMISGKTFTFTTSQGSSGTFTFNSNGTGTSTTNGSTFSNGLWSINAAGQFILTSTTSANVNTLTIISNTGTVITANVVATNATNPTSNSTYTIIFTALN